MIQHITRLKFRTLSHSLIFLKSSIIHPQKDYYKILNIPSISQQQEIKQAFKVLAKQYHPDINQQYAQHFQQIKQAYQVLGQSTRRKQYDRLREDFLRQTSDDQNTENTEGSAEKKDYVIYIVKKNIKYVLDYKKRSLKTVGNKQQKQIEKKNKQKNNQKEQKKRIGGIGVMPILVWGLTLTTSGLIFHEILSSPSITKQK